MTLQPELKVETHVFNAPTTEQTLSLKVAAKRYTVAHNNEHGFTLLLTHGSGFHKELWEPTITRLFDLQRIKDSNPNIREIWAFDWQGHGDSALLNESALKTRTHAVSVADLACALVAFLETPHVRGHRIVAIGHSAGSSAWMYSTKLFTGGQVPYVAIILVEPPLIDRETFAEHLEKQQVALRTIKKLVGSRRDVWPSKEQAFEWFRSRLPWKTWDEGVLLLFCEYGLRPTAEGATTTGVTTKCDKAEEVKNYEEVENTFEATEQIEKVCHDVPIHVIFGEIIDLTPSYGQDAVSDQSKGRVLASLVRIPGAGHMIVQQKPGALASQISTILGEMHITSPRL